jgi:hypothetical protein
MVVAASLARAAEPQLPSVPDLLERVATYLGTFEKDYARLIADERYKQTMKQKRVDRLTDKTAVETREIKSDILAAPDSGSRWLSFRDVYSVDGRAVRDRNARLEKLFAKAGDDRLVEARRIADEGARFNLGTVIRNTNLPAMPLTFITNENRARSAFRVTRRETVAGVDTVVVEFEEMARPTLVKSGSRDVPASGSFWIEPQSGRVIKANVKFDTRLFTTELTVTFGLVEKLKMWVPVEMADSASNAVETVTGLAVYTNYRRFDTSFIIK